MTKHISLEQRSQSTANSRTKNKGMNVDEFLIAIPFKERNGNF